VSGDSGWGRGLRIKLTGVGSGGALHTVVRSRGASSALIILDVLTGSGAIGRLGRRILAGGKS